MRRIVQLLALAVVVALPALALACSSGGAKPAAPTSAATPLPTAPPLTGPQQTAVAAGPGVALAPYADPDKRFTVGLPQGWAISELANATTASLPGSTLSATIGIFCAPGINVAALIVQDQNIGRNVGTGGPDPAKAQPGQAAGVPAQIIPWTGRLGSVAVQHVAVYFEGKGCAWRIQLNTFGGASAANLRPLLDRVVASFKFV